MIRIFAIAIIVLVIIGFLVYQLIFGQFRQNSPITSIKNSTQTNQTPTPVDISIREQLDKLETEIQQLKAKSDSTQTSTSTATSVSSSSKSIESRLNTLETLVASLQTRINQQSGTTTTTTTSSSSKQPTAYIPLGDGGSSTKTDWTTSDTMQIEIDTSSYPNYTNMQLEARINVKEGSGRAYARLYNSTDSIAITTSEVSTTSYTPTWVTSSTFTLTPGKKTYKFQLKTLTPNYDAIVTDARIKVNF